LGIKTGKYYDAGFIAFGHKRTLQILQRDWLATDLKQQVNQYFEGITNSNPSKIID
jgi:hypothetical protein